MIPRRTWLKRSTKPIRRTARRSRYSIDLTHKQKVAMANELWRHLIYRKEPGGTCPRCMTRKWVDACHVFAKGPYPGMRFELDNGIPLCRTCHRRIDTDHKAKEMFARFYLGPERYARLDLMSQARGKTDVDLVLMFLRTQ